MSPQFLVGAEPANVVMRSKAFARGVEEVRAGLPPDFNIANDDEAWNYERGRLWAVLAPLDMPLFTGKRVNKKALEIFRIANGII